MSCGAIANRSTGTSKVARSRRLRFKAVTLSWHVVFCLELNELMICLEQNELVIVKQVRWSRHDHLWQASAAAPFQLGNIPRSPGPRHSHGQAAVPSNTCNKCYMRVVVGEVARRFFRST